MPTEIIINALPEEVRVALLENKEVVEICIDDRGRRGGGKTGVQVHSLQHRRYPAGRSGDNGPGLKRTPWHKGRPDYLIYLPAGTVPCAYAYCRTYRHIKAHQGRPREDQAKGIGSVNKKAGDGLYHKDRKRRRGY